MLSIHPTNPQSCTPNLLPARINHNGPINDTQRYWKPETDEKGVYRLNEPTTPRFATKQLYLLHVLTTIPGTQHAYFRGRHLHGTPIALPSNYTGAILNVTDKSLPTTQSQPTQTPVEQQDIEDQDDEEEEMEVDPEEIKIAEQIGSFDSIVVWEHGGKVDEEKDGYVRGVREWIGWAESMHVDEDEEEEETERDDGKTA